MTWFENNFDMWLSFHSSSEEILCMCILVQDLPLLAAPCRWDHHLCTDLKQEGKCSQKDCDKESFQTIAPDQMHVCTEFPDAIAFWGTWVNIPLLAKGDPPSRFEWDHGDKFYPPLSHFLLSFRCLLCLLRQMMPGGPGQAVNANQRPSIDWSQMWFLKNRLMEFHCVIFFFPATFSLRCLPGHTQNKLHAVCPHPNKTASFCRIDIYLPPMNGFVGGCLLFVMRFITMS